MRKQLLLSALASIACGNLLGNSPPVILSNGGGDSVAISFPENKAVVTTVRFSDADGLLDLDVLSASSAAAWYANNGTGGFVSMKTITTSADAANSV